MCLTRFAPISPAPQGDQRVPAGRHRKTRPRTLARRLRPLAGFGLALATAIPITASAQVSSPEPVATAATAAPEVARTQSRAAASRSRDRLVVPPVKAKPAVKPKPRWTTTRLNVRSRPSESAKLLTVLGAGVRVLVTGRVRGQWAELAWKHRTVWVLKTYLASTKPKATTTTPTGVSGAPCPDGSSVENGLQPNTVKLYRAVCAAFPAVSAWGGRSGSGDHGAGRALDIMCTGSLGDSIANYVRSHASRFGVSEVIWEQRIWSVQRSSEGWRPMEDRGSTTANHYDHVHVSVY
jgi:Bacterial SH3 domain